MCGSPHGVVAELDCGLEVNEFDLQSRNNVHFRINTLGQGMNPFILFSNRLNIINCSTRVALALDESRRLICHETKKPKFETVIANKLIIISFLKENDCLVLFNPKRVDMP